MTVNVADAIKELLADILGNRQAAIQFAGDPYGELAARGITEGDLSNVDVNGLAREVCGGPGIPSNVQSAVQSATGGSAPHPPARSVDQVVQQVQQVTYVAYEGDTVVTNHIINNNNQTDIDVEGDFHGDIDIDNTNTSATDGGVASSGEGDVTAATGERSNAIGGDNNGNQNSGDGAVLADGDIDGAVNTGTFTGAQAGRDISAPVVTGPNSGIIADGDVEDAVVGNNNQTANVDGSNDGVFNFGGGTVNQANNNDLEDSSLAVGGDSTNVSNNDASQGGAISGVGDSQGNFQDDHSVTTTTTNDQDTTFNDSFNADHSFNDQSFNDLHGGLVPSRRTIEEDEPADL